MVRRDHDPDGDVRPVTTAPSSEDPGEVARRAMIRPAETRFDPLVICDADGSYVGVVTVERLLVALAGRLRPIVSLSPAATGPHSVGVSGARRLIAVSRRPRAPDRSEARASGARCVDATRAGSGIQHRRAVIRR